MSAGLAKDGPMRSAQGCKPQARNEPMKRFRYEGRKSARKAYQTNIAGNAESSLTILKTLQKFAVAARGKVRCSTFYGDFQMASSTKVKTKVPREPKDISTNVTLLSTPIISAQAGKKTFKPKAGC